MPEEKQTQEQSTLPKGNEAVQEKTIIAWEALSRPYKERSRDYFVKVFSIASLFGVLLYVIEGFMPVLLLISVVFLFYVMSSVKPQKIRYEVTNLGIKVASDLTPWEVLGRFWSTKHMGYDVLVIEAENIVGRMEIILDPTEKTKIKAAVSKYLPYEEIPPSQTEKVTSWVTDKLQLS